MTVKELIAELQTLNPDAPVVIAIGNSDGCDTCGYGESETECPVIAVYDLEARVAIGY